MRRRCRVALCVLLLPLIAAHVWVYGASRGHGPQVPSADDVVTVASRPAAARPADAGNLIRNGGFETPAEDKTYPAHWQQVDNLVFHWTKDPSAPERGRVIRIDTDVYQGEAYAWWVDRFVRGEPLSEAPKKVQPTGHRYDTIGGLDGAPYWSDFIEVKKGGAYKISIDARGPAALVFIRGYEKKVPISFGDEWPALQEQFRQARGERLTDKRGRPIKYRLRYRYTGKFTVGGTDEWRTYTHEKPRHPNSREITENVRFVRICIYPFWPAAEYWFDNVRVVEAAPDTQQAKPDALPADVEEGKVVR